MPERLLAPDAAASMQAGFFGKIPARGDFVQRSLPAAFTAPWDRWLQAGIAGSRAALGDAWLEIYLTSPIWRFALAAGMAGDQAAAGVLMPSVDQVGRYFPLTIACVSDEPSPTRLRDHTSWFDAAETLALAALEEQGSLEALIAGTAKLDWPESPAKPSLDAEGVNLGAKDDALMQVIERRAAPYGLFWTTGSERVRPTNLVVWQLPARERFCALLDGDWTRHGWADLAS